MGTPPLIVFSHANGFPAGTYRVLFELWRAVGYQVEAVEKYGHDPRFPVTSNWPRLRDELIHLVEHVAAGRRAHLVGHSLGGYLSLLAACRRPELVASVVMIDSPVLGGWRAQATGLLKATGLITRVSPGRVSQRRRMQWESAEQAHAHFAAKRMFARFDARVLADYVRAGTEPAPGGGVRLSFSREVETRIYNTLAHHGSALLARHPPRCAVSYLAGTRSWEGRTVGMGTMRTLTHGRIRWVEGSHLFPMEQPELTASLVLDELRARSSG